MIGKTRKFHGWIMPGKHRSHLLGSVVGLRNSAHVFEKGESLGDSTTLERFDYIGCVHGGNQDIYHRLQEIAGSGTDYVIFAGDLTGSPLLEELKSRFYQEKERGMHQEFEYFGSWASTLSKDFRRKILTSVKSSVTKLLKTILTIKRQCDGVILLEGNWDNPKVSGVRMIAGEDIKDYIDVKKMFAANGLSFVDHLYAFETKSTLHILIPYISLLNFDGIHSDNLRAIAQKVDYAHKTGKTVVMVGHAQANWKIHHLGATMPLTGERAKVISNFGRAIALFAPHEVIYPHQHVRLQDERGRAVDVDTKYLLAVNRNTERVRLVENTDNKEIPKDEVIATYLPFGYVAQEDFLV